MDTAEDNNESSMIGRRIGVYELRREIGRGGMGAVYLAERADGEFYQMVAVKLIKRGMDTDLILKRFRRERQILAALNHPNIAYFLGGGSTADGLPYFVMEYIEGKPLYRFCDENKLSVKKRLRIFRQICDAAHAAHQIKVIHRDLKPSNILVKNDGKPKLLDFGIAKVLDPELEATEIEPTETHLRALSPEYASPEQVRGDEITPASDVYSLGVVLYELLAGHRPYRLKKRASYEVARIICEEKPLPPSESVSREENIVPSDGGENARLESVFVARSTSPEDLRDELSGDLDKIILKTLRKNPAERYASAAALAQDITNYLEELPVNAESFPSLEKYSVNAPPEKIFAENIAENTAKKSTTGGGQRSIAVLPFKIFGAAGGGETSDEYLSVGLADALITRLSNVRRFVVRPTSAVLRYRDAADPLATGRELDAAFVLESRIWRVGERFRVTVRLLSVGENATRWAQTFDEDFTDFLALEDSISEKVAASLVSQLSGEERENLARRPTDNPKAFEAYLHGRFYWHEFTPEGFQKAIEFYRRAVALAPDYALAYAGIADYYNLLGVYTVMPFAEASAKAKEAALRAIALDDRLAESYAALGFAVLMSDFDWTRAEECLRRSVELNPHYATARVWFCYYLTFCGRFDEALEEINVALEIDRQTPLVLRTYNWALYHAGRFDEAIVSTLKFIESDSQYGFSHLFFSSVLRHVGRYEEALQICRRAIKTLGRSPYTLPWLASAYAAAGNRTEAEASLEEIEEVSKTQYVSSYLVAMIYANLDETENALVCLEKAAEIRDGRVLWLGVDPQFETLRGNPRFEEILKRTGNPLIK